MSEWQPIPKNKWQSVYRPKREIPVSNGEEAKWLKEVFKVINKGNNRCSKLDLLEVYAYPESNLTTVAQQCGMKAERFTIEDGDLSTSSGRSDLLATIILRKPSHIWLSPECKPWSAWNRFNAQRSIDSFNRVM